MIDATRLELGASFVRGGEAKIRDCNAIAFIEAKDILWLQVPVVNAQRMDIFYRI